MSALSDQFFKSPIINSPYDYPTKHWELDESGQPTQKLLDNRRGVDFVTPIPKPKRRGKGQTTELDLGESVGDSAQRYHSGIISGVPSVPRLMIGARGMKINGASRQKQPGY